MGETTTGFCFAIGAVIGLVIATVVADHRESKYRKEAIERNYAEWVVDTNGNTKWRWKEVQP